MPRRWQPSSSNVINRPDPGLTSRSFLDQLRWAADARLLALALVLFTFIFRIRLPPVITDDAYITFRYAENLARGAGFVFNEGERVLGTTTPLFAIALAVVRLILGMPPTTTSLWIAAVADAATVYLLYRLGTRAYTRPWPGLFAGLLFALSPLAARFSINGMETSLAVALILATMLMYLDNRLWAASLFAALGILVRPEAGLLAILLAVGLLASGGRKQAAMFSGSIVVIILPWVIFASLYYGSPFPHSITAKSAGVYLWSFPQTLSIFFSHFAFLLVGPALGRLVGVPWPGAVQVMGPVSIWVLAIALAALQGFLVFVGVRRLRTSEWVLVAFPALYLVLFLGSALRNVNIFDWYLAPLQPFYFLFIAAGLLALASGSYSGALVKVGGTLLVLSQIAGLKWSPGEIGVPLHATDAREQEYRRLALEFEDRFRSDILVAAPEIGALGYYSNARILDTVGLVSPIALSYYPIPESIYSTNHAIPPELIREAQPDYIVTLELFVSGGLLRQDWFRRTYVEIQAQPSEAFGGTKLLVFQRNDISEEAPAG